MIQIQEVYIMVCLVSETAWSQKLRSVDYSSHGLRHRKCRLWSAWSQTQQV